MEAEKAKASLTSYKGHFTRQKRAFERAFGTTVFFIVEGMVLSNLCNRQSQTVDV